MGLEQNCLDIIIETPQNKYRLQWKDDGVRLMWNDRIIAHGFPPNPISQEVLREAVEKIFNEIRDMINNVLGEPKKEETKNENSHGY